MKLKVKSLRIFFATFLLFVIIWLIISISYKNGQYDYDPVSNYQYALDSTKAIVENIKISNNSITVKGIKNHEQYSCFLEVEIGKKLSSVILQPNIEIISDDSRITNTFEYRAKGKRYINISRLIKSTPSDLKLKPHHASIKSKEAKLFFYKNPFLKYSKVLVLAPHPDDAEIAAYGLYSSLDSAYIVTVTVGEGGGQKYSNLFPKDSLQSIKKGSIRAWNSITTPMLAGISPDNIYNLGYFDSSLGKMRQDSSLRFESPKIKSQDINIFRNINFSKSLPKDTESSWRSLVKDMEFLLKEVKPDVIVTPHPLLDSHPDHINTTYAIYEALGNLNIEKNHVFLLYTNHCLYTKSYPFGKMGEPITLPPGNFNINLFESVYSHRLNNIEQMDKILALESMYDLRMGTEWITDKGLTIIWLKRMLNYLRGKNNSYFRRSVRDNELFFISNYKEINSFTDIR